jgi:RimJ/RimL family protein N-acetyltransferase
MSPTDDDQLTERLSLRRPDPDGDLAETFAIFSDPALWTHAPESRHSTPGQTREWLARAAGGWERDGLSYWIVRLRGDETIIGSGGVGRDSVGGWNVFYRLASTHQGRGLATEVARAGLDRAAERDPSAPCIAWIRPINLASRRVAQRVGLTDQGLRVSLSDREARLAYADRPLDARYGAVV